MPVCCTPEGPDLMTRYLERNWTRTDKNTQSHRRIFYWRRPSNQRRSKSSTQLSDRMCVLTGRYRRRRDRFPKDDGGEYPARRTTSTSTAAIRSWEDWFPCRGLTTFIRSGERNSTPRIVYYYTGRLPFRSLLVA